MLTKELTELGVVIGRGPTKTAEGETKRTCTVVHRQGVAPIKVPSGDEIKRHKNGTPILISAGKANTAMNARTRDSRR